MILDVITYPNARLRLKSEEVTEFDKKLHILLDNMYKTMQHQKGVGLAAIQVNITKRIYIINIPNEDETYNNDELLEIINPEILEKEGEIVQKEGCLSVPEFFEDITRYNKIKMRYQDRLGDTYEIETEGYLAVALQHELDHLNGILFVDRISSYRRKRFEKEFRKLNKN